MKTKYPHIERLALDETGALKECLIVKKMDDGNIFLIPLEKLDSIDKKRILRLINTPNASRMEMWEVMSQTKLQNGMNALTYFHQMVLQKVGDTGLVIKPSMNRYISPSTVRMAKEKADYERNIAQNAGIDTNKVRVQAPPVNTPPQEPSTGVVDLSDDGAGDEVDAPTEPPRRGKPKTSK